MLQVALGSAVVAEHVGKVADAFRTDIFAGRDEAVQFEALQFDLLFEQRLQNHGRRARIFHAANVADVRAHGRGGGHQRIPQFQSQISGG